MVNGYNSMIPGVVQMKASQGKHVVVDMNTGFTMLSPDGIHPDQAGYNTMGTGGTRSSQPIFQSKPGLCVDFEHFARV
jgi:hypothetical protein